jgi:hypothetical protein
LARYRFSYTPFVIAAPQPQAEPTAIKTLVAYRPLVSVRLDFGRFEYASYAYLDSGADQCVFPGTLLPKLGLDIKSGRVSTFSGVGSTQLHQLSFSGVGLTVDPLERFTADVAFTSALNITGIGLLGQRGFFSRFRVDFDLPKGVFYIEEPPAPPSDALTVPRVQ